MIRANDPVRKAFADCSSGPVYYETKGHAISAFGRVLFDYDYTLGYQDMPGDEGRAEFELYYARAGNDDYAGRAIISWYRMPSGRYEVIGYIA